MTENNPFEITSDKFNSGKLDGKYRHNWVEESFVFEEKSERQVQTTATRNYLGISVSSLKFWVLAAIILAGLFLILIRVLYLQGWRGDYYRVLAEGNRIRLKPIPAERGIIYDSNNLELVQNIPSFVLAIIPRDLPQDQSARFQVVSKVSQSSGLTPAQIEEIIRRYKSYSFESLVVKENLDYNTALQLYIENANLPGVLIESGTKRLYLNAISSTPSLSLSHLLGYMGKLSDEELAKLHQAGYLPSDNIGKSGLEKQYESELRGKYGRKKIEVDSMGREQSVLAEDPPRPGKNITLSLDLEAQAQLEKIVRGYLDRSGNTEL